MDTAEIIVRADEGNFVRFRTDAGFEAVRDSEFVLPREFVACFPDDRGAAELHLRIHVRDGVPQCRELMLSSTPTGPEVRPVDLRSVDVELMVEIACQLAAQHVIQRHDSGAIEVEHSFQGPDLENVRRLLAKARRNTRRRLPDAKLPEVAEIYRANPGRPVKAVSDHFDMPERTAGLYIRRARDAGLLEEPS